jgi:N-acetylneuraminic acid mutarotase
MLTSFPAHGAEALTLQWQKLASLPDPVGLKGLYGGVSDGHILLAGGSNFPVPARSGGRKTFHRTIYVQSLPLSDLATWRIVSDGLPRALGEGATVTVAEGVVCLGGHDGNQPVADAFVLRWDGAAGKVLVRPLPPLPSACANSAAAFADGHIYVAGGESAAGPLSTLWRLDLRDPRTASATARWETLPPPPGRPRFGGILVAVTTPSGPRLLYGGGVSGPAKSQDDYLRDLWLFDPTRQTWTAAAPLPRGAVLAATLRLDDTRALVLGGSDGHDFARMKELGERYRIPSDALLYDASADRWSAAGTMPLGVVGAAAVPTGGEWLLAGGEYSPGLRTAEVHALRVRAR